MTLQSVLKQIRLTSFQRLTIIGSIVTLFSLSSPLTAQTSYPGGNIPQGFSESTYPFGQPAAVSGSPIYPCEQNPTSACFIIATFDDNHYGAWTGPASGLGNTQIYIYINGVYIGSPNYTTNNSNDTGLFTGVGACCTTSFMYGAEGQRNGTSHGHCVEATSTWQGGTPSTPWYYGPNYYVNFTVGIGYNCN